MWGSVVVNTGSRLVLANGAHLEAGYIELHENSILDVRSSVITLENHTYRSRVGIFGECDRFIVAQRSVINVRGSDGAYDIPTSRGGDAVIQVEARVTLRIEGSIINLTAGSGLSPPEPLTSGDVGGDAFAGGDAILDLVVTDLDPLMAIRNAEISLMAGDGGDAPDGLPPPGPGTGGRGGGFTRGGNVTGSVASGGEATATLDGRFMDLRNMQLVLKGGRGGHAGDGGPTAPGDRAGGGGGGYSGGDGAHADPDLPALPGGRVGGMVGSGGDAFLLANGAVVNVSLGLLEVTAGPGGDAGRGGDAAGKGGAGGGGYSGGGGGSQGLRDGADGGSVGNTVARGGDAEVHLYGDDLLDIRSTGVFATGGNGGTSGDGGNVSSTGGAGGGGASGGGGGGQCSDDASLDATDGGTGGRVSGFVASGGVGAVEMSADRLVCLGGSSKAFGGDGGDEGESGHYAAGVDTGTLGGAGGGGRSSGGGAGRGLASAEDGSPGPGAKVDQDVGQGGESDNRFTSEAATISADTAVGSRSGRGGEVLDHVQGGPLEGYSVSGDDLPGARSIHVPMSLTILTSPVHESSIYQLPTFEWVDVHDSTDHGQVVSYILVVDDDEDFASPEKLLEVPEDFAFVTGLKFGVHYWYVRAVYEGDLRTMGPESAIGWFSFYNAPPRFHIIEPESVYERRVTQLDLSRYIFDPDTPLENLTLFSEDPEVLSTEGVTMTLYFDGPSYMEWVHFSISDGHSTNWFNLPVKVIDVNDPPTIISVGGQELPATLVLNEGEIKYYEVVAEDRDNEALRFTLLTTWQDMRMVGNNTFRVLARPGMLGERTAKILVEDERHAVASTRITIRIVNTPDPPEDIQVFGPKDRSSHKQLDPVTFTIKVSDPDLVWGEEVNVTLESDISGHLVTRRTSGVASFTTHSLPLGAHVITITVDDGHFERTETLHITIVERPDPPGTDEPQEEGIPPLAILLLVVMPLVGYYLGRKGVGYAHE